MKKWLTIFMVFVGVCTGGVVSAANNCTGATYYDADSDTCIACPVGYTYDDTDGKTTVNQCKKHCDAGTYVGEAGVMLAPGYTQVEYIQSNGNQWIDTGISPTANFDIFLEGMITTYVKNAKVFATDTSSINVIENNTTTLTTTVSGAGSGYIAYGGPGYHFRVALSPHRIINYNGSVTARERTYTADPNATLRLLASTASSTKAKARIYDVEIYDGTTLVFHGVPAVRNVDGVAGLYDIVPPGRFLVNSGSGQFTVGGITGACVDPGVGYYAVAETVNFGDVGTRTACPVGTYSNATNATSAATCTVCANATYNDTPAATACTACPTGYDYNTDAGKTSINQCQIHCNAGTYINGVNLFDMGKIPERNDSGGTIARNVDGSITVTTTANNSSVNTNLTLSQLAPSLEVGETYIFGIDTTGSSKYIYLSPAAMSWVNNGVKTITQDMLDSKVLLYASGTSTSATISSIQIEAGTTLTVGAGTCVNAGAGYWSVAQTVNYGSAGTRTACPVGTYSNATNATSATTCTACTNATYNDEIGMASCKSCPTGYDYNDTAGKTSVTQCQIHCDAGTYVAGAEGACVNVGAGYYSSAQTVNYGSAGTRNACPAGTTTVGYGHGADSANDCGRTLHVGDNVLYMRKNKETSPAVGIDMGGGDVYYISLSPTNHNMSPVHFWHNGGKYTAYDDSLFYNERSIGN